MNISCIQVLVCHRQTLFMSILAVLKAIKSSVRALRALCRSTSRKAPIKLWGVHKRKVYNDNVPIPLILRCRVRFASSSSTQPSFFATFLLDLRSLWNGKFLCIIEGISLLLPSKLYPFLIAWKNLCFVLVGFCFSAGIVTRPQKGPAFIDSN